MIELNQQEQKLYNLIPSFDVLSQDFKDSDRSLVLEAMKRLTKLLMERSVIPKCRLEFFENPSYNLSDKRRSRAEIFERNSRDHILDNLGFLKYLDYFIHGTKLPDKLKQSLKEIYGGVAFDDEFQGLSRKILRDSFRDLSNHWSKKAFADEVFKECLELGLDLHDSQRVYEMIMKFR